MTHFLQRSEDLAKLKTEALSVTSMAMASGASRSELEAVAPHTRMASHASHPATEEGLEDAVGVHIMEAVASAVLKILSAVIHPPLLLITQDGVSFSNLQQFYFKILYT